MLNFISFQNKLADELIDTEIKSEILLDIFQQQEVDFFYDKL